MNVAIVQYNAGNIFSVDYALRRLGVKAEITGDVTSLRKADKVIFPGVGEASTTMAYLRERGLDRVIASLSQPVLGICIGMQLLCKSSEEGSTDCIGIFSETVSKFRKIAGEKIPHMGWNSIQNADCELFRGLPDNPFVYYVHSFRAEVGEDTVATTDYAGRFSAALKKDNFYALQFHPEKSGDVGTEILKNFIAL